jgi:hypothetical protein
MAQLFSIRVWQWNVARPEALIIAKKPKARSPDYPKRGTRSTILRHLECGEG